MSEEDRTMPGRRAVGPKASFATMRGACDCAAGRRFLPGDVVLGRYEVQEELGQGGMGIVYKCFDQACGVTVALKAMPPELSHSADEMADVRDKFQLVADLVHQNIAVNRSLEKDNATGDFYLIMECARGEDLKHWLRRHRQPGGGVPRAEVLPILRQVASALDYAHGKRIMHRDIKPGNIMVSSDGEVKVLDFGLAAQIHTSLSHVSMAYHGTSGTGAYMAPEQWQGRPQGAAADQYALAVTAYELLAGYLPFDAPDTGILREAVLKDQAEPVDGLPPAAQAALARAMSKNPRERFGSCGAFVAALAAAERGGAAEAVRAAVAVPAAAEAKPAAKTEVRAEDKPGNSSGRQAKLEGPKGAAGGQGGKSSAKRYWLVAVLLLLAGSGIYYVMSAKSSLPLITAVPVSQKGPRVFTLPGGVELKMAHIPAGRSFMMGSPESEAERDEVEVQHQVSLTRDYWLGVYEVTQKQYEAVMRKNPSCYKGSGRLPVECVSWADATAFCTELNRILAGQLPDGYHFDLPTEAQWEYACRAGSAGAYGGGGIDEVAWYERNSGDRTHEAGQKRPNAWGLYDMHGNVWEWCRDWNGDYPAGPQTDPLESWLGSFRVNRGGSWFNFARYCRVAYRDFSFPSLSFSYLGFRLALVPVQ